METLEALLAAYLDINLLLIGTALLWLAVKTVMKRFEFRYAFTSQLLVLKTVVLAAVFVPAVLAILVHYSAVSQTVPITLSDLMLAQYLQGNLSMNPSLLESLLAAHQNVITQIANPNHPLITLIVLGMLLSAGIMVCRAVFTFYRLRKVLGSAHKWRSFGKLDLLVSDTIRIPFSTRTAGKKYIVLPSTMLRNRLDTKVAVAHELQHLRQRDVDWEICASLLTPIFFWNPAFHYLKGQVEELRELSCDQQVLRAGRFNVADYCNCLLRACANKFENPKLYEVEIPKVALIQTRIGFFRRQPAILLKNRIASAFDLKPDRQSTAKVSAIAIALVLATGVMSFSIQKPTDWSQDRLMLSAIVNLDRLEQRNTIGLGTPRN